MADHTGIEWTDATWQPITGCSVVSPGCTNCYAMRLAGTRLAHHPSRSGLTRDTKAGPVWTGEVRLNEQWLDQPLRWRRPRRIFVCAHGDLFHEAVPDEWIDRVFAVMACARQHTFQILTKRAARMRAYLERFRPDGQGWITPHGKDGYQSRLSLAADRWPLPNVWLGVSVEDQARADERIPDLLRTPAAVRFISAEPLLGPVDLRRIHTNGGWYNALAGWRDVRQSPAPEGVLDWVIVGGESGPGARPMHPDWARSLRDQCLASGVAFFFKQWGDWATRGAAFKAGAIKEPFAPVDGRKVTAPWGEADVFMARIGKDRAGRLLDGREWDQMPAEAAHG